MSRRLNKVRDLCRLHNCEFRVVVFPFLHNLADDYPFRDAHAAVVEHCRASEIPVVDLAPILTKHAGEGLTVNPFDAHPNRRAHKLAAEAIEQELLSDLR